MNDPGNFDFDVAIIGGGSGGYAAARTAASAGLRTAVIEGGDEVGGLCILRGCMPSKALLYASEVLHLATRAPTWGIHAKAVAFDFVEVMARKNRLIKQFADDRVRQLTEGSFHLVVAPPLASLREVGYLTSDAALALARPPRSLIVLGGGAVAAEFAQFFARFGVEVTVIQRSAHLLRHFDEDAARELEKVFRREGMKVLTGSKLLSARRNGALKEVSIEHQGQAARVEAEEILFALGRVANIASLALEKAGVATARGAILTNERMETTVPHIYAAGDCTGPHEIVHIAIQQGETAAHNIAHPGHPRRIDYRLLLSVVFTEPQLAIIGLSEKEAIARAIPYRAASYPFNDHGKSLIMEAKDGFVKLLADPLTGEIIGGSCVGPLGGELIHEIVAAMAKRMTVRELAAMPHYHPTLAEIWTYPAEELAASIPGTQPTAG